MLLLFIFIYFAAASLGSATRSNPFQLVVHSENATYDGKAVTTCHQGALITSLCISKEAVNLSSTEPFALNSVTASVGFLEFLSPAQASSTETNENSTYFPMNLQYYPYTNVAMGFFQPHEANETVNAQQFTFDTNGRLVMSAPIMDDALAPNWQPAPANSTVNRWYVCDTWAPAPYRTTAIVWGLGRDAPQNPTCQKVDVVKVSS
ncbi:uncharacterized protein PV09_02238 [Verruconis gallopava]|uniref:DUF7907 domain-containing protein n=1 Tax=Verruconis gallopava TaxID=253628 RepID=A0A0D1XX90_9PEZI|nr:uncharacterized protein PV09_02238 [Verruconis gallopava]KIW07396.1 hypothetical protein PV09_02238 [Verruconis gallopava]